jgi:hypothetical protein
MSEERGPWYLLTGLILGAAIGLVYAWLISPHNYADTSPASLQVEFKAQYRAMIALAYMADGNLARAQARLDLLKDEDAIQALNEQAQRSLAGSSTPGVAPGEAQALGLLAVALGQPGTPANPAPASQSPISTLALSASPSPQGSPTLGPSASPTAANPDPNTPTQPAGPAAADPSQTPAATRTLGATGTPLPTRTPTPTPVAPFVLKDQTFICDQNLPEPLLIVLAESTTGQPLPGVEAVVNWEGGEDHFFTGLKPELGPGYADFAMTPGVVYALRLTESGQPISDLTPAECETPAGERYWGSWVLLFNRP